jgi:hypothetical protein
MTWSQGDFNYDGIVNFADLNKVLTNYHRSGPLSINNLPALAYQSLASDSQAMQLLGHDGIAISGATTVPEPSGLVLLASLLAVAGVWRRLGRRTARTVAR